MKPPWCERVEIAGGRAVLYLGDNREVWPALGVRPDAVVTDPPYGIGITRSHRLATSRGMGGGTWDDAAPDISSFLAPGLPAIVWGGNYFDLPPTRCVLVWDKENDGRDFADVEVAWSNLDAVARIFRMRPMNMDGGKVHPAQKPSRLMTWCLDQIEAPGGSLVADPYMGSGTTGVACMRRGCRFVGIEIDEGYFRTACRRIAEAARQPDLLIPETAA